MSFPTPVPRSVPRAKPAPTVTTRVYLRTDKDSQYELAKKLRLGKKATSKFVHELGEVECQIEVNRATGEVVVLTVDGMHLEPSF